MIMTIKIARTMSAASEVDLLKSISSKMFEESLSIMAPTKAKRHLRIQAKKVARKRGSLK
jgi:hypothetical protein